SPELLKKYSQRSVQRDEAIEEFRQAHDGQEPTNDQITGMVQKTRKDKPEISTAEVRTLQQARLSPNDREELRITREKADSRTNPREPSNSFHSLQYALDHVFERVSVACEHEILEVALQH